MSNDTSVSHAAKAARFAIMLNAPPSDHLATQSAVSFARSALASGHEIITMYFYHDAVWHVCETSSNNSESRVWLELAQHGVALLLCQAAGERRGLDMEAAIEPFRWAGLPGFHGLLEESVTLVSFGHCVGARG
jgi:tRNA 2-thiouridine synthesizing protein D